MLCGFCRSSVVSLCKPDCKFSDSAEWSVVIPTPSGAFVSPGDLVQMQILVRGAQGRAWKSRFQPVPRQCDAPGAGTALGVGIPEILDVGPK